VQRLLVSADLGSTTFVRARKNSTANFLRKTFARKKEKDKKDKKEKEETQVRQPLLLLLLLSPG